MSPLKDGEQTDARAVWRSQGVCHVCHFMEIYVSSKITYAQQTPPNDCAIASHQYYRRDVAWRNRLSRVSHPYFMPILPARRTPRALSDGESFHLLGPPASLNPIEMTMEQRARRSLARVYSFLH